jgi:serine protease inhibitor
MIKKMEIPTTAYGLNPFTTFIIRTVKKPSEASKTGVATSVWINQETGVQVAYIHSQVRFYNMADPVDHKEYWDNRKKVKAAFVRSMGWRK